jgi:hypothetical protein
MVKYICINFFTGMLSINPNLEMSIWNEHMWRIFLLRENMGLSCGRADFFRLDICLKNEVKNLTVQTSTLLQLETPYS